MDDFIIIRALVLVVLKLPICYFIPLNHKTHALPGLLLLKKLILYLLELLWLGSKLKIIYFILSLSSLSPSLSSFSFPPLTLRLYLLSLAILGVYGCGCRLALGGYDYRSALCDYGSAIGLWIDGL